jgi:hypothetical protein
MYRTLEAILNISFEKDVKNTAKIKTVLHSIIIFMAFIQNTRLRFSNRKTVLS